MCRKSPSMLFFLLLGATHGLALRRAVRSTDNSTRGWFPLPSEDATAHLWNALCMPTSEGWPGFGSEPVAHLCNDKELPVLDDGVRVSQPNAPTGMAMLSDQAEHVWAAVKTGFALRKLSTSRSGADLYFSSHDRFILKLVPDARETDQLRTMTKDLEQHFHALGRNRLRTAINPILFQFESSGPGPEVRRWILLVGESVGMAELASSSNFSVRVIKEKREVVLSALDETISRASPAEFDVKPYGIISEQRQPYFHYIEGMLGLGVWSNNKRVQATLVDDVAFLGHLIDYSLFGTFQLVEIKLTGAQFDSEEIGTALPRCTWQFLPCDASDCSSRRALMLCFSIIDYLKDFDTLSWKEQAENRLMGRKWDMWPEKVTSQIACMTDPCHFGGGVVPGFKETETHPLVDCTVYRDAYFETDTNKDCQLHGQTKFIAET